jgi:hypothetical protein
MVYLPVDNRMRSVCKMGTIDSVRLWPLSSEFAGGQFGQLITHWVPIGTFAGPYPFFDSEGRLL